MTTIYVDISNYYLTRAHTGIQRVVREFLLKALLEKSISIQCIYFDLDIQSFILISQEEVFKFLNDYKNYVFNIDNQKKILKNFISGDIFFDMDGVWNNPLKRIYLYKELKKSNVVIVNFIYDLAPIIKPQFSHGDTIRNFISFLYSVYQYSDLVLFDSRSAELDFIKIKERIGNSREIASRVIKLGADISTGYQEKIFNKIKNFTIKLPRLAKYLPDVYRMNYAIESLIQCRYLLFVGTLEPRKSQDLLLQAFDKIKNKHEDLKIVFVGKMGWNNDEFIDRLKNHELLDQRIFWLQGLSDNELTILYQYAYICVYLSKHEGFGLPIAESLGGGKLTIASNNSSMFEVGKHCADYLNFNTVNELSELLDLYLSNETFYQEKIKFIKKNYIHYSWNMMVDSTINVIKGLAKPKYLPIQSIDKLQFVFISIDLEKCIKTINKIDQYISFVKEYIIVTRKNMVSDFSKINTLHKLYVVDENIILGKYAKGFASRDHQSKNWILRSSLVKLDILDNVFVMLDDDNQPFKEVFMENFICNGRYNGYYYYDLLAWKERITEYDEGQNFTKIILDKDGYELLSYSSHRPQIIDKRIWQEVIDKYFDIGLTMPIDEWSVYFNYAVSNYPMLFNKKVFDTLNWPGNYSDWGLKYIPTEYNFNNYYPENDTYLSDNQLVSSKKQSFDLYQKNLELLQGNIPIFSANNMVHGVLSFKSDKGVLYLLGLPYYFEAKQGTWIDFPINLKWHGQLGCKVEVGYFFNGNSGHFISIPKLKAFDDRTIGFKVSCDGLQAGCEYDLMIDVKINDQHVYQNKSPYMVKLFIV